MSYKKWNLNIDGKRSGIEPKYAKLSDSQKMELEVILKNEAFIRRTARVIADVRDLVETPRGEPERRRSNRKFKQLREIIESLTDEERDLLDYRYAVACRDARHVLREEGKEGWISPGTQRMYFDEIISAASVVLVAGKTNRKLLARAARPVFVRYNLPINYKEDGDFIAYLELLCTATGVNPDPDYTYLKKLAQDSKLS